MLEWIKDNLVVCIVGVVLVLIVIVLIVLLLIRSKRKEPKTYIKDGVRYTTDNKLYEGNNANVTVHEKDYILAKGTTYKVGKKADLLPGIYTLLLSNESSNIVKVRVGLVRDFTHNSQIALADGQEITPVSDSIILR
ncbi:MAG: hypothetical protein LBM99_00430 [Bacillales bacterium]|jgi:hypothetical protein|nr:hypothetical protein [Bacillales bacterium]